MTRAARIGIVGAGPGGTALALALTDRGVDPRDVVLYDKARFPRGKLCGGGVTFRGTQLLDRWIGPLEGGLVTDALEFRSALGCLPVRERGPQRVYDRGLLDHALVEACRRRGIEVREECAISAVEPGSGRWRLVHRGGVESHRWTIGADGANGLCRRASGLPGGLTGRLVEAVYEPVSASPRSDTLIFDFDPILDGIPGYAWIFPYVSPDHDGVLYKIGVMDGRGRVPGDVLRRWTDAFAERCGYRRLDARIAGWPERYFDVGVRGARPGLLLVGEALGIDALLGEGIAPALWISEYAAGRLRSALDAGVDRVEGYEQGLLWSEEGRNLWFQARLADRLYGPNPRRWLRVLFGMPHLHALAAGGQDAYGRLVHHVPWLVAGHAWTVLRHGLPSDGPVPGWQPTVAERPSME